MPALFVHLDPLESLSTLQSLGYTHIVFAGILPPDVVATIDLSLMTGTPVLREVLPVKRPPSHIEQGWISAAIDSDYARDMIQNANETFCIKQQYLL